MKIGCISFWSLNYFCKARSIQLILHKSFNMKMALLSALVILAFSGCTKTTVNQVNQVYSAVYTVAANQWAAGQDPDGTKFYYTSLSIPELTQNIDLNGGVVIYLSFDDPSNTNPVYEALPEVINGVAYGAIHTTGMVTIDLRAADGSNAPGPITGPTMVKVVLMDASPLGN
jgi:hypothetical protein